MKDLETKLYTTQKEADSLKYNLDKIKEMLNSSEALSQDPNLLRDYHKHVESIESNA